MVRLVAPYVQCKVPAGAKLVDYLAFEALHDGRLTWDQKLTMSENAESKEPFKLAVGAGRKVTLREAVESIVVLSANDSAVAIAEQLGDSEAEVEHHDGQQRTAIGRIGLRARGLPVAPAAFGRSIHAAFLTTSSRCRSKRNVRHVRISKDGMMKPVMIGQLASETSTKVTTIRFYESIGLLRSAPRTASGRRTYDASDIERLHFIRNGRRLGFSVDEIRSLMGLAQNPDQDCGAASAIAAQHLKDVEERLAQLAVLRDELAMLSQSCTKARMADCRIMKAIGKGHPQADQ